MSLEEDLRDLLASMKDEDVREYIVSVCSSDIEMDIPSIEEALSPLLISSEFVINEVACKNVCAKIFKCKLYIHSHAYIHTHIYMCVYMYAVRTVEC
jgi:hypothetical protein